MRAVKVSTAREVMIFMADSADHVTGKTGLTLAIVASKAGAAFASIVPSVTERGYGWYDVSLTVSHLDTVGDFVLHVTGTDADPTDVIFEVVAYDPQDAAALGLSRVDVTVSSRLASTSYTAPDNTGIAEANAHAHAVDTRLPSDPADESLLEVAIATRAVAGDSMALTSGAVDAVLDDVVEGSVTLRQALRVILSALVGKVSGAPAGPLIFRDIGDTKARVTGTVDADGNRLVVTIDGT